MLAGTMFHAPTTDLRASPSASMLWMSSKQGRSGQCFRNTARQYSSRSQKATVRIPARHFEAETESANTAEEIEDRDILRTHFKRDD
jgi:hypothetical protein